mgnify:FL=1
MIALLSLVCAFCGTLMASDPISAGAAEGEPPCPHAWDSGSTEKAPDCTHSGSKVLTCILCGEKITEPIQPLGHNYETAVIKEATCTETGKIRNYCLRCGTAYEEVVPATEHNYFKVEVDGNDYYCHDWKYECQDCDAFYYESTGTEERTTHDLSNATSTISQAPTCTASGIRAGTCALCGEEGSMEIPALDHDWVVVDQNFDEASNTTTVRYECSRCTSTKSEQVKAETDGGGIGVSVDLSEILNRVAEYYQESIYGPYQSLLLMLFGIFAAIWGIPVGVSYIIARKQDDKEKAKKMLVNFVVGIVVSFCLLVAAPFLVNVFMQVILSLT